MCDCALFPYAGGGEQEAGVLVVNENQPCAVEVGKHLPHADCVAVADQRLPVLHQHAHHVTCLRKQTETAEVRVRNSVFPSAGSAGPHVGAVVEEVGGDSVAVDAAFPVVVREEFHLLPLLLVPAFDLEEHRTGEARSEKASRAENQRRKKVRIQTMCSCTLPSNSAAA